MKHKWLVLSATVLAGSLHAYNGNSSCSSDETSCEPCCIPKPRKCIDCECYSPPFYDLQCDWGIFLYADFLYWYGKETNLDYAIKLKTISRGNSEEPGEGVTLIDKLEFFDASWDPGVRVGFGWNNSCDGWDVELNWTYYHTKQRESESVPEFDFDAPSFGNCALFTSWQGPFLESQDASLADRVKGKWNFRINSLDLQIGRRYWTSPCFTLRPFGGLRGSWTKTRFEANTSLRTYTQGGNRFIQAQSKTRFDNKFWGIGLLTGIEPTWYWTRCFALYGGGDIALLWGKHQVRNKVKDFFEDDTVDININFSSQTSETFFMQSVLDLEIGFRYENTYCCDRYRFNLDAGWEHHIWFNHNNRYKSPESNSFDINQTDNSAVVIITQLTEHDVSFGGFVLRARFDF